MPGAANLRGPFTGRMSLSRIQSAGRRMYGRPLAAAGGHRKKGKSMSSRSQIIMVWWTMIFFVMYGVAVFFIMGLMPPPSPLRPDLEVAQSYSDNSLVLRIGVMIALATAGCMLPFSAVISYQMAKLKGMMPWAILQGMGGALMTMWLALPLMFWGVAAFTPERAADLTRLMNDLAWLTFITSISHYIFQVCAISYVCLTDRVESPYFPRWLGYLTVWTFFVTEVGVLGFLVKSGPFAWNGLFVFWFPVSVFTIWIFSMATVFVRGLRREAVAEEDPNGTDNASRDPLPTDTLRERR